MTSPRDRIVLLVASANAHKVEEISAELDGIALDADSATRLYVVGAEGLPKLDVDETGDTFEENASLKALAFARAASRLPPGSRPDLSLADDSGLCVDALGGRPGVRSARYASEDATDDDNNRKLLEELQGRPRQDRGAEFVCVMACARVPSGDGDEPSMLFHVTGRCRGEILETPRGDAGFGYDPLFYYEPLGKTFAELGETKSEVSHRGHALREFRLAVKKHLPEM